MVTQFPLLIIGISATIFAVSSAKPHIIKGIKTKKMVNN